MVLDHRALSEYFLTDEVDTQSEEFTCIANGISKLHPDELDAILSIAIKANEWLERSGGCNGIESAFTSFFAGDAMGSVSSPFDRIGDTSEFSLSDVSIKAVVSNGERSLVVSRKSPRGVQTCNIDISYVLVNKIFPYVPEPVKAALVLGILCQNSKMTDVCMESVMVPSNTEVLTRKIGINGSIDLTRVSECICEHVYELPSNKVYGEIEICDDSWRPLGWCIVADTFVGFEYCDGDGVMLVQVPPVGTVGKDLRASSSVGHAELEMQYYSLIWKTLLPYLMFKSGVLTDRGFSAIDTEIPSVEADPPKRAVVNSVAGLHKELDRLNEEACEANISVLASLRDGLLKGFGKRV